MNERPATRARRGSRCGRASTVALPRAAAPSNDGSRHRRRHQRRPASTRPSTRSYNPSDKKGGTIKMRQLRRLGHPRPGRDLLRLLVELRAALRPLAADVQAGPGHGGQPAGAGPRRGPGQAQRQRQDLDLQAPQGREVRGRHRGHVQGRQVRGRALDSTRQTFPNGPAYFERLARPAEGYKGPYKDARAWTLDSAIETPDDHTIVFHLKQPFAGFDYLAQLPQTMPVPQAKDTGAKYQEHVVSTGPVHVRRRNSPARASSWFATTNWDQADRPEPQGAAGRVSRSRSTSTPTTSTTGSSPVTSTSTSRAPACSRPPRAGCSTTRRSRRTRTTRSAPRLWYTSINPTVHAVRQHRLPQGRRVRHRPRSATRRAYGGAFAGGDIATTLLPPHDPGLPRSSTSTRPPGQQGRRRQGQGRARRSAASRTASRPTSPTGPSGRRRRRPPKRSSRRWPGSASS